MASRLAGAFTGQNISAHVAQFALETQQATDAKMIEIFPHTFGPSARKALEKGIASLTAAKGADMKFADVAAWAVKHWEFEDDLRGESDLRDLAETRAKNPGSLLEFHRRFQDEAARVTPALSGTTAVRTFLSGLTVGERGKLKSVLMEGSELKDDWEKVSEGIIKHLKTEMTLYGVGVDGLRVLDTEERHPPSGGGSGGPGPSSPAPRPPTRRDPAPTNQNDEDESPSRQGNPSRERKPVSSQEIYDLTATMGQLSLGIKSLAAMQQQFLQAALVQGTGRGPASRPPVVRCPFCGVHDPTHGPEACPEYQAAKAAGWPVVYDAEERKFIRTDRRRRNGDSEWCRGYNREGGVRKAMEEELRLQSLPTTMWVAATEVPSWRAATPTTKPQTGVAAFPSWSAVPQATPPPRHWASGGQPLPTWGSSRPPVAPTSRGTQDDLPQWRATGQPPPSQPPVAPTSHRVQANMPQWHATAPPLANQPPAGQPPPAADVRPLEAKWEPSRNLFRVGAQSTVRQHVTLPDLANGDVEGVDMQGLTLDEMRLAAMMLKEMEPSIVTRQLRMDVNLLRSVWNRMPAEERAAALKEEPADVALGADRDGDVEMGERPSLGTFRRGPAATPKPQSTVPPTPSPATVPVTGAKRQRFAGDEGKREASPTREQRRPPTPTAGAPAPAAPKPSETKAPYQNKSINPYRSFASEETIDGMLRQMEGLMVQVDLGKLLSVSPELRRAWRGRMSTYRSVPGQVAGVNAVDADDGGDDSLGDCGYCERPCGEHRVGLFCSTGCMEASAYQLWSNYLDNIPRVNSLDQFMRPDVQGIASPADVFFWEATDVFLGETPTKAEEASTIRDFVRVGGAGSVRRFAAPTPTIKDVEVGRPGLVTVSSALIDGGSMLNCVSFEVAEAIAEAVPIYRDLRFEMRSANGHISRMAGFIPALPLYFRGVKVVGSFFVVPPGAPFALLWGAPLNIETQLQANYRLDGSAVMRCTGVEGKSVAWEGVPPANSRERFIDDSVDLDGQLLPSDSDFRRGPPQ